MMVIVHPYKGNYKILFIEEKRLRGVGITEITSTPKGDRPVHYRLRWGNKKQFRNTPTKDLIMALRKAQVRLTRRDVLFESFLESFQIPFSYVKLCRICLLGDRVTPIDRKTSVRYGKGEQICFECAKRELRREMAHMGRVGRQAVGHLEELLRNYRDMDRVLASIQPDQMQMSQTLFDRLEAHPVQNTQKLEELPLPREFVDLCGIESLMPAQQMAVDAGLLFGKDLLIVSATASGKTFIGEMAGFKNFLEGRGQMFFLVPLVALAVQKYQRFEERYGGIADVGIMIGKSRINLPENRPVGDRNVHSPIVVGTYEGVDHMIRSGKKLSQVGTVVIDEVQMLEDEDRGHRLDGLIARLKYLAPKAQFLYLSATIGVPNLLAKKIGATLVRYDDRPVSLERYLVFLEHKQKIPTIKRLCKVEYTPVSSKGFHGQTIVFSNSRARCHVIADALGPGYAAYHAGLTSKERRNVENLFLAGKLKAVVTTAALGAGVDFPASQVIFDSLAMGISWLSVQEFNQMAGRAGRPDYHDLGKVVILAEPGATYARGSSATEEEMAMRLLKGEMEEVAPIHDVEKSSEEYVANAVVCRGDKEALNAICNDMVGTMETVLPILVKHRLVAETNKKIELTPLSRVMAEHFIGVERLLRILSLIRKMDEPVDIAAELECGEQDEDVHSPPKKKRKK
ncbi:MAG TPA: DEAD/DEAH box helicase [Methanoregulaceae archaeon]|nr:DEAD/DEAH box helicase [Methanoregulaceae archaeon]